MLSLLDEMDDWATLQRSDRNGLVKIAYRRGRSDVPKQSADIGLESSVALRVVAVWDSGEIEAEVVDIKSMSRLYLFSGIVRDERELREVLDLALRAAGGQPDVVTGLVGPNPALQTALNEAGISWRIGSRPAEWCAFASLCRSVVLA